MATHTDFGNLAERKASEFLQNNGYTILYHNYRYQKAEIDLIAEYGNQIVFVEVKARKSTFFSQPYEAVNRRKIKLILSAAHHYLECHNLDKEARFDIISMIYKDTNHWEIDHIENAFNAIEDT